MSSLLRRVGAHLLAALLFALGLEVVARVAAAMRPPASQAHQAQGLNPYQQMDEARGVHVLRPGMRLTLGQLLDEKQRTGRMIGYRVFKQHAERCGLHTSDVAITINRDGFRGSELQPLRERPRVLCLGDSCTFGLSNQTTYPVALQRELSHLGIDAEVINGGVEGYAPRHLLARLDDYRRLQPAVVTIYLGWNSIYEETAWSGLERWSKAVRGVHAALEAVHPHNPYTATKRITATASELEGWRHRAQGFIPALEKVLDGLQGTQVVLCTLPGLYEGNTPPSTRALEIGHMPPLTCDPTALAALVEGYNAQLRSLARRRNLGLIDLETWGHAALTPRDELFFDSLHLWENGQARIGQHMAQQLAGLPVLRPPIGSPRSASPRRTSRSK